MKILNLTPKALTPINKDSHLNFKKLIIMKALKFSLLTLSLTGLFLASCKKETQVVPLNGSTTNLYARTLKVYDTDGINGATLRFQSLSNELLESIALEKFTFTLVKTPTPTSNSKNLSTSSLGTLNFSENNTNRDSSGVDDLKQSNNAIYVDIISGTNTGSVSIEVQNKVLDNSNNRVLSTETLWPSGVQVFFHGSESWHRIQIDNLSSNALNVSFYYNSCDGNICSTNGDLKGTFTQYSGYSFTLYKDGWAWYSKCSRAVGALITVAPNTYYHYRWTTWKNC